MGYSFDHVHLKSTDPGATADWYVKAFNFKITSDAVRPWGDRFIRCETEDGRGREYLRRSERGEDGAE